jgi:DNA modification methylase
MSNTKPKLEWRTEKRRLSDLISFGGNPQVQDERSLKSLTKSLKQYGLVEIPVIDADNTLLAGHGRKEALETMGQGDTEIDVRVPSRPLTKDEREKYLLVSNAVHGSWDYDLLRQFDTGLLLDIGFDSDTLAHLWDDHLEVEDDSFNEEKELRKIKEPTVKVGDLYKLGNHRLICGDSTDEAVVRKLVGEERIDFVDTDSPYNIKYSYKGKDNQYGGAEKDDRSTDEFKNFLGSLMRNAMAVSKPDAHYIFWCDERWVWLLQNLYRELGIESKRLCLWIKGNAMPTPEVAFNKTTEFACYGTCGKPFVNDKLKNLNTVMNKETGSGNRLIEDIMDLLNIWLVKRLPGAEYEHPTQKPPTLHEKALRRCTRPGDTILDLCAGSGSLMIASESMERRAFLSEIDPLFATLIINRYEKLTGKKAELIR